MSHNNLPTIQNEHKPGAREIPIEFIGSPGEYWKIYMVNLALTLLTLGLYRPWAKVRQAKYLYNHLLVDGIPMNFTAKPLRLLKGQLIVMGFMIFYIYSNLIQNFYLSGILLLFFLVSLPLLQWFAYRFFFRYTEWSGVSMAFNAPIRKFYLEAILRGIISLFGVTIPLAQARWFEFIGKNVRWGEKQFSLKPSVEKLYLGFGLNLAMIFCAFLLIGVLTLFISNLWDREYDFSYFFNFSIAFLLFLCFLFLFILGYGFSKGFTLHTIYHGLKIGNGELQLHISPFKLSWEYAKMYLFTLLSLGFAYPYLYAKMLSTITNNASLLLPESESLVTHETASKEVSAIGVEALDDFGYDLDFDISL